MIILFSKKENKKLREIGKSSYNPYLLKSAIQKAYRRNYLDLFDWVFDALWEVDPKWVLWRSVILPAEENWQQGRAIGKVVKEIRESKGMSSPEKSVKAGSVLKKALISSMRRKKNKDGDGLRTCGELVATNENWYEDVKQELLPDRREPLKIIIGVESFAAKAKFVNGKTWEYVWGRVDDLKHRSQELNKSNEDYMGLRELVGAFYFRGKEGGMVGDRTMLVACSLLALDDYEFNMYSGKTELETSLVERTEDSLGGKEDWGVDGCMPWFAADMHTRTGKKAVGWFCKNSKFPKDLVNDLWFLEESALVNEVDVSQYWWWKVRQLTYKLKYSMEVDEASNLWRKTIGPDIKNKVEYLLKVGA